jgi:hypothetical protein
MAKWFSQLRSVPAEKMQDAALTPQQMQLLGAIDFSKSSGDAWGKIGKEGVLRYMQDSLKKNYGTDDLSKFRYVENAGVPGGYSLDWEGRQPARFDFKDSIKKAGLQFGTMTAGGGEDPRVLAASGGSGDGLGNRIAPMNAAESLNFGQTWEGKGGTGFAFFRKPDGSVGIKTGGLQSNDKGDIISALGVLGAAFGAQALAGASGAAGGAAAGAAEGAAAAGAAEGAAAAGALDLGGGLAMTADGAITGTTMAGGAGMSGAALDATIAGSGLGYTGPTSFGVLDQEVLAKYGMQSGVGINNGVTFGVVDQAAIASAKGNLAAGAGGLAPAGGGGGGAAPPATPPSGLGSGPITGSKLGDMLLKQGASAALSGLIASGGSEAPSAPSSGRSPESITKAVSEMPDPIAQQRARKRSLTEQLGRRGRASTIMTKPSGRLGG